MARAHPPHIELQLAALFYLQRPSAGAARLAAALRAPEGGKFSPLAGSLADAAERALAAAPADRPEALEALGLALGAAARECAPAPQRITHHRRPADADSASRPGRRRRPAEPSRAAWQTRADLA